MAATNTHGPRAPGSSGPRARCMLGWIGIALALGSGCSDEVTPAPGEELQGVTIAVRFEDEGEEAPQSFGLQSLVAPIVRADVDRIVVDVRHVADDRPIVLNVALDKTASEAWEKALPVLPASVPLKFVARAYQGQTEIFAGDTQATLTTPDQEIQIPLSPRQNDEQFDMPRMRRMVYPEEVVAGQGVPVIFTIQGNAGETIGYDLASADGSTPFSPASGTVTLTNTVADFITLYTAPEVTAESGFDHEVTLTSEDALSSVEISTSFATRVIPRAGGAPVVRDPRPGVIFRPVVLSLNANGTAIPGTVEVDLVVSNDGPVTFEWSFAPGPGTPAATFLNSAGNPALLEGYTVEVQGLITVRVTDPQSGTTTLKYELLAGQFEDVIDHAPVEGITRIATGSAHTCVLTNTGKVRCWGDNQYGQLGHGNVTNVGDVPRRLPYTASDVPLPEPALQVVAGNDHTCALLQSGFVYCWGRNDSGQLGYGTTARVGDDEALFALGYVTLGGQAGALAAGGHHTCALLDGGALRCWGRNDFGQLGRGHENSIGDDERVYTAGNVNVGAPVAAMFLGESHACALLASRNVRCWGRNTHGQLGYGHGNDVGDDESLAALPDVLLPGPVRKLAAGPLHTCALMESGSLRCWGHGVNGATGYGFRPGTNPNHGDGAGETPLALPDVVTGAPVTDVAAGGSHTCAMLSGGALVCWGNGADGRLGYGNATSLGAPLSTGVNLDGASPYRISAGAAHTCALRSNGTVRCWGLGGGGRLGQGLTSSIQSPVTTDDIAVFEPAPVAFARSCRDHLGRNPTATDGVYVLAPAPGSSGSGGAPPAPAYCDMTREGGGWTPAMRFAPSGSVFTFFAPQWDTSATLAETGSLEPTAPSDAKLTTFNLVTGRQIRGCLRHPVTGVQGCKSYEIGGPRTLLDLFATTPVGSDIAGRGRFFQESTADMLAWLSIQGRSLADASFGSNYVATGINIDDDQSCYDARVRFGLALNNESNIFGLNDTAGFGASAYDSGSCNNQQSAWQVGAGFAAGPRLYHTAGTIWIR